MTVLFVAPEPLPRIELADPAWVGAHSGLAGLVWRAPAAALAPNGL
jgi:hypothetical protein